ncbi:MAG: amidohydrolase family protein [Bacteroidetes bacterium]|nr:amidohydrolase family protein [Rhodothermia bacterium]MCX7906608.1 amidohydrolase family protein [Bacteroidota bacterium]MDW8285018.1 amidohydrolase family protein [Bacteroidota bacterium]
MRALCFGLCAAALVCTAWAQPARRFGDLAEGPYRRLIIHNVMVIPGHGGPPVGPYDIIIEGNTIRDLIPLDPVTARGREHRHPEAERVIDGTGLYAMPGLIDLHCHLREEPMELEYVYYLKLAHGVTTMVPAPDRGLTQAMEQARLSAENRILAPRMFPIWSWGAGTGRSREELENPQMAPEIAREMVARGAHVVSVGNLAWNPELFGAVCRAVWEAGGITTVHLPPSSMSMVRALEAARLGVTMIEHHYGYAESALDNRVQNFGREYNYDDENHRFRYAGKVWTETNRERLLTAIADSLVRYGVTMLPTRVVYEANRDILRAISLPWHEKYTHQALINWNLPNPAYHGAYHWDWTSDDEYYWYAAFELWGRLIYEFNKRGGRVAYGTDDNYIWATPGFSNVRELQLLRETGLHTLEVIRAATYNSAQTLRQPRLGLIRPGYLADLILVDGSPLYNLRFLYSFGALTLDERGQMRRTRGIVHTIKDGIVIHNARLMEAVARMVARSRQGVDPRQNVEWAPFLPEAQDGRRR